MKFPLFRPFQPFRHVLPSVRLVVLTTTAVFGALVTSAASLSDPGGGARGSGPGAEDPGEAGGERTRGAGAASVPFAAGRFGYDTFRVPAALVTPSGALLAFAEGRVGGAGDSGHIDLVVRRSADGGRTWGPLVPVLSGRGDTRGNPAPVVDPATGRIVLLSVFNGGEVTEELIVRGEVAAERGRRVFVQFSADDGVSFNEPREITDAVKLPHWRWYATGPGHAIALARGPHAGRLVVPANHSAAPPEGSGHTGAEPRYYGAHALISDDGGVSWRIGYVDGHYSGDVNSNESQVAELPDGRLYFTARDQKGRGPGNRVGAWSEDGGRTLAAPFAAPSGLDGVPVVQGSVLQLPGAGGPLLFAAPSAPGRRAMAVWRSDDAGATFAPVRTLSPRPAAYSDLVLLSDGTPGLLYETGEEGPYERIEFHRLDGAGPAAGGAG